MRSFWSKEEIPRWIGLTLVGLYTLGLTVASWTAVREARQAPLVTEMLTKRRAVRLLGALLQKLPDDGTYTERRWLREFSRDFDCPHLRIVGADGKVLASQRPDEVGKPTPIAPEMANQFPTEMAITSVQQRPDGRWQCLFRLPLRRDSGEPERFLEGAVATGGPEQPGLLSQAATLWVILAAVAALLLFYRRMRHHFRGVTQIAENLPADPIRLEQDLATLRVADSLGTTARSWNALIDVVEELQTKARRSVASDELCQALERSGAGELAGALNALPDGFIHLTEGWVVRYANSRAIRLMGWQDNFDGSQGRVLLDELDTSPLGQALLEVVRQTQSPEGFFQPANQMVDDDDGASTYRVRVLPLGLKRGGECIVVITDVSQQTRADRAREEFVSQVTHELRTPLTNIRAYAETLSSGVFDDPKVISDCYNVITKETRRLSRLIEDILSVSQMEAGSIQLIEDDVDVRELISDAVCDLRGLADDKNIDLQLNLPAKLGKIRADRDKLTVVLNNLLGNALKYTPSDGSVRVGCKTTESQLLITVQDSGIGIDPADQERIFEKFQRADDADVQAEPGTGIGLTTAREIARRHKGDIEVMSAKGEGSTFVVKLPMTGSPAGVAGSAK
ncbi:MAG: ATP-binding protein [Phycisphaerae bacterium]